MNIWQIIRRLVAFVRPYKGLVIASLLLTLLGAVAAQVNPIESIVVLFFLSRCRDRRCVENGGRLAY